MILFQEDEKKKKKKKKQVVGIICFNVKRPREHPTPIEKKRLFEIFPNTEFESIQIIYG